MVGTALGRAQLGSPHERIGASVEETSHHGPGYSYRQADAKSQGLGDGSSAPACTSAAPAGRPGIKHEKRHCSRRKHEEIREQVVLDPERPSGNLRRKKQESQEQREGMSQVAAEVHRSFQFHGQGPGATQQPGKNLLRRLNPSL